jgi:hypothetical protein
MTQAHSRLGARRLSRNSVGRSLRVQAVDVLAIAGAALIWGVVVTELVWLAF